MKRAHTYTQGRKEKKRFQDKHTELGSGGHACALCLDNRNDDAKETNGAAENLNDENLDKEGATLSIGKSSTTAHNTDANTTGQIAKARGETTRKQLKAGSHAVHVDETGVLGGIILVVKVLEVVLKHNGHDNAVDGHSLAKDNADKILRLDAGSHHTTTNDAGAHLEDTPSSTDDRDGDSRCNAKGGPHVGRGLTQELSNVEAIAPACQAHKQPCSD